MCIAIVKPADKQLSRERLEHCFRDNPHGAGYGYIRKNTGRAASDPDELGRDGGVVDLGLDAPGACVIRKGFFTFEEFYAAYLEDDIDNKQALIHFRITTRGDGTADNCHPFPTARGILIHNGTISGLGVANTGPSDTALLAKMIHDIDPDLLSGALRPLMESYLGWSRVAWMGDDGSVVIFNRKEWKEDDGVLYSNGGFKAYVPVTAVNHATGLVHMSRFPAVVDAYDDDYGDDDWIAAYARRAGAALPGKDDEEEISPHVVRTTLFGTTLAEYGFQWENDELWLNDTESGFIVRDRDLENMILDYWFEDLEKLAYPEAEDQATINWITIQFLEKTGFDPKTGTFDDGFDDDDPPYATENVEDYEAGADLITRSTDIQPTETQLEIAA